MRVLCIEKTPDGLLDIAIRAQMRGHAVRYFLQSYDQHKCPVGRGLVERAADWRSSIAWADLVILGSNDLPMREIERLCTARGVPWIGGTEQSARWENDRLHGMAIFKRAGIPIPPVREFTDYDQAIAFVEDAGEPMYCKPCWADADKALSCKTGVDRDPAFSLRALKRKFGRPKGTFIIQESIKGIEMGVGAWFGPGGFAPGFEENFEFKRLCSGDMGPNTGEMGSVLRLVEKSKLAARVLRPIEDFLHGIGYVGNIDVNTIVDDDGTPWPLEFTIRCGWPSTNIEQALYDGDFIEFLAGLAIGKPPKAARRMNEIAVGVVLALPPFPFRIADYDEVIGMPIYGVTPSIVDKVHLAETMADGKRLMTAGDYVLVSTGTGPTVVSARDEAYRVLSRLTVPNSPFYRNDVGNRLRSQLDTLQAHGYAADMRFA